MRFHSQQWNMNCFVWFTDSEIVKQLWAMACWLRIGRLTKMRVSMPKDLARRDRNQIRQVSAWNEENAVRYQQSTDKNERNINIVSMHSFMQWERALWEKRREYEPQAKWKIRSDESRFLWTTESLPCVHYLLLMKVKLSHEEWQISRRDGNISVSTINEDECDNVGMFFPFTKCSGRILMRYGKTNVCETKMLENEIHSNPWLTVSWITGNFLCCRLNSSFSLIGTTQSKPVLVNRDRP